MFQKKLSLKVLSPTIIASSEKLSAYDIFHDNDTNTVRVVDLDSITSDDVMKELKNAMDRCVSTARNWIDEYSYDHLQKLYKSISEKQELFFSNRILNKLSMKKQKNSINVQIHHKIGKELIPYIPGSSVKGFARHSILKFYIQNGGKASVLKCLSDKKPDKVGNYKECLTSEFLYDSEERNQKLESSYRDVFKFVQVSDFVPENYTLSLRDIARKRSRGSISSGGLTGISQRCIMIESGTFSGSLAITLPSSGDHWKRVAERFCVLLAFRNDFKDKEEAEKAILIRLLDVLHKIWEKDGFHVGYGTGSLYKSIAGEAPEFRKIYEDNQKKKGRWPPQTYYITSEDKRLGLVSLEEKK